MGFIICPEIGYSRRGNKCSGSTRTGNFLNMRSAIGFSKSILFYRVKLCSVKFGGSILSEIIEFFNLPNPSCRTMALGSTQPLTKMGTRNFPG
jgi:hypothetical protein